MLQHQVTKISGVPPRTDFTLRLVPELYFYNKQCLYQASKWKVFVNKCFKSSNKYPRSSFARFCVSVLRSACSTCGRNKCHWRIVAIVERLNRLQGNFT